VIVANDNKTQILGTCTTNFLNENVKDVLYLSDFNLNLLSVRKITQDLNCDVIFSPNKVTFQDRVTGKKIGEGMFKNGLYYLEDAINKCFISMSHVDRDKLLHYKFGHPSDQVLNKFFCYKLDSRNCDICKLAK
jgi:hypothetical protein